MHDKNKANIWNVARNEVSLANEERAYTLLRNVRFDKIKNQEKIQKK